MAVIYCYRALAWRDSTTAVELGPDPGCPFPEPNPLAEWFGDSWPAALSADGAIGLLNRAQAAPPPIYKTFSFGFAGADETWEEVAWQSNHPDGERPPNASANDITPDGSVVVGTGWLESPFPGFDPSDARAWLYRPGDVGPTWLPWSGDRIESAIAVSDDGATIAGCCADPQNDDRTLPVLWHGDEPPVTLASPPGVPPPCVVNDLSGDGSVAVGRCDSIAVRWVDGEPFEIPVPPDDPPGDEPPAHEALAVSRDGSVVLGSSFFTGGPPGGWLWTEETGARSVHDVLAGAGLTVGPDQQLRNAVAMSADGKVLVGFAEEGRGASHAAFLFRAVLP
jgi:uncharacterized membrane protein